jgi:heme A synthase
MQTVLVLHVVAAVVLWLFSGYGFLVANTSDNQNKLATTRFVVVVLAVVASLLGAATALLHGSLTVVTCGQLALYLSPSFLAYYALTRALQKRPSEQGQKSS